MSDDQKQYRSRLHKTPAGPVKGIGSGYAQNQALAGAADPEAAARAALVSDSEHITTSEKLAEEERELDDLIEDIVIAVREGVFDLPDPPAKLNQESQTALIRYIASQPPDKIKAWHADVQKAYDARIEEEDEVILEQQLRRDIGIDPADPLYDPMRDTARRKQIEEGLKPLDFEEMVFKGWTTQEVPVRESFKLTFRTIPTQHGLWLEAMMARTPESSVQHTRHFFSLLQLAAGLDKINGRLIGGDIAKFVKDDQASREGFEAAVKERMEFLGKLPSQITDDLIIQQVWFNGRVRRLLAGDLMRKVGNS